MGERAKQKQNKYLRALKMLGTMAVALALTACATPVRAPVLPSDVVAVPVRFFNSNGDTVDGKRPVRVELGYIAGALMGLPHYPIDVETVASGSMMAMTLPELARSMDSHSGLITEAALETGLKIDPANTRFARIATTIEVPNVNEPDVVGDVVGFVDADSQNPLVAFFFDRPCRLSGRLITHRGQGDPVALTADVVISKPGISWLQFHNDGHGHTVLSGTGTIQHPLLVVVPLSNLKDGRFRMNQH